MMNVSDFSRPSARDNASGMSTTDQLAAKLNAFRNKFSDFVARRTHAGYDELNQGLMADQDNDDSRVGGGTSGGYSGPVPGSSGFEPSAAASAGSSGLRAASSHVPSQAEEIVMLSSLAREAAELLWEMVATEDVGDATQQMRDNASTIQAQLRGLIGDYSDSDEGALAAGLEAYDMLNNVLEEHTEAAATSPKVFSGGATTFGAGTGGHTGATGTIPPAPAAPGAPQFGAAPAAALGGAGFGAAVEQPQPQASPSPPPRQQPPTGLIDDAPSGQQEERPLIDF